jgi:zinc transport system permease protein
LGLKQHPTPTTTTTSTIYVVTWSLLAKLINTTGLVAMIDVLLYALLAGLGVAAVTGPLGAFIVWRRMAYFGDTLAHSSLLGVALALLMSINPTLSVIIVCLVLALILVVLQQQQNLASDTLLGILSHTSLAIGLVAISLMPSVKVDLLGLLFGDLLTVTAQDIVIIYSIGSASILLMIFLWRPLLSITIHEELARVEGIPVTAVRSAFMLIIALEIAIAMKVVGILLITSLLVIPAATARRFARTPEQMALLASLMGCMAVICGLSSSWFLDTPAGPSIVLCAGGLFLLSLIKKQ